MMQRSLTVKPTSPPAPESRGNMLDSLMAAIPDSVVEEEHKAAARAAQSSATGSTADSASHAVSDDETEHLPEAPAVPSLRMRLYLSGSTEERSSLCNFLETTESLASTSKEPPAKRVCLWKELIHPDRCAARSSSNPKQNFVLSSAHRSLCVSQALFF